MQNYFIELAHRIGAGILGVSIVLSGWLGYVPPAQVASPITLGAYSPSGGGTYHLKSSAGITDTTILLSDFKEPVSEIPYTMTYLNSTIGYGTIEPQTIGKSEFVSFTGITQNTNGSAILTGVTRGLTRTPAGSDCTASTSLAVRHGGQSIFILSDSPCHFAEYAVKRNDETITGSWLVPTPTASTQIANKTYVDTHINGGTVTTDSIAVAATAGESVQTGQILYFNKYYGQWFKASALLASTSRGVSLGIAQGTGTAGLSISGGVMIKGLDSKTIGGTSGTIVYLSDTTGATSTSAGTYERPIGIIKSPTQMYFDPSSFAPSITVSTGKIDVDYVPSKVFGDGRDGDVTINSGATTTLTRDMYYNKLTVNGAIVQHNWRIFVADTLSGTGNIMATGTPGTSAIAGTPGLAGATTTGFFIGCGGGVGGGIGAASGGANGSSTPNRSETFTSLSSGIGGTGGIASAQVGGSGGTVGANNGTSTVYSLGSLPSILEAMAFSSTTYQYTRLSTGSGGSGGGAGSGGGNVSNGSAGGGGGECGGIALVVAHDVTGSFNIKATGGFGGAGGVVGNAGGGGGGGGGGKGGMGILVYRNKNNWSGTCTAVGGPGGAAGTSAGTSGSAGASGADGYCIYIDVANVIR